MNEAEQMIELRIQLAVINERWRLADMALKLAQESLSKWQEQRDLWRQELVTHTNGFVSRTELIAVVGISIAIAEALFRWIK